MKRRRLLLVALLLASITLVGCVGGGGGHSIVNKFVRYVETGNYEKLDEMMPARITTSWKDLLRFMGNIKRSSIAESKPLGEGYVWAVVHFLTDGIVFPDGVKIEGDYLFTYTITFSQERIVEIAQDYSRLSD
jgi:hypothetical protein